MPKPKRTYRGMATSHDEAFKPAKLTENKREHIIMLSEEAFAQWETHLRKLGYSDRDIAQECCINLSRKGMPDIELKP